MKGSVFLQASLAAAVVAVCMRSQLAVAEEAPIFYCV
jgi:hypothetical protein